MATVLEQCRVQPSSGSHLTLPLTHFDMPFLTSSPSQRLLFIDFTCSKPDFLETIVPHLKESLCVTLKHFLPLAGNLIYPIISGRPVSRYVVGDSVSLTIAECDKDFNYLTGNHPRMAEEFYACVPQLPPPIHLSDSIIYPVMALQVTLFPGHGVCFGLINSHAIADECTIVGFVKEWASVNRFGSDSELIDKDNKSLPFYDRTFVEDPEGLDSISWNTMKKYKPAHSAPQVFPLNRLRATFVVTKDEVQKLKNFILNKQTNIDYISSFTVISAYVWVCLVRSAAELGVEEVSADEPEFFAFAANCRARLSPPLPSTYFGNCAVMVIAESKHGELKGQEGFLIPAELIGKAIQKTVYHEKGVLHGADWPVEFPKWSGKRGFSVAGSPRFNIYDADFGWGKAKKYEFVHLDEETSMSLCKSREFKGGFEIGLSRPKIEMDAFAAVFTQGLKNMAL
ncbi:Coumaroyl-CoA:anthocyanidin 3-O-glucoside-6''-O-coumaroyltransferase 1 [Forsythia ovata]|uniref:Coumaroyl-CoA:anthocyanidin 3-O-glucoside-6''-O-coumaroyltransferase 1 n=1 Tax=Forsythia ovata TaxID=205694 RepID=A0ABD1RZU1_9LAMI